MDVSGLAQSGKIDGITFKNGKYTLEKNIEWFNSTFDAYISLNFNSGGGYEFDGKGHTICIETINYTQQSMGLFKCVGVQEEIVVIKNLVLKSMVKSACGGIVRPHDGQYFLVENCKQIGIVSSTGDVGGGGGGGGICGSSCNNFTIKHCKHEGSVLSDGTIIGGGSGGICGANCNNFTIVWSKNKGYLGTNGSAGICGSLCQNFTISHCKNYGKIGTIGSGGFNIGGKAISGGGICSNLCHDFVIEHCSQYGDINDTSAGGIVGPSSYGSITVTDCTSEGTLNSLSGGGICGQRTGECVVLDGVLISQSFSPVLIERCKFKGNIYSDTLNGNGSGGIVGRGLGYHSYDISASSITVTQSITVNYCEFIGKIINFSNSLCGGIVGYSPIYGIIGHNSAGTHTLIFNVSLTITNCVVKSELVNENAGICGSDYFLINSTGITCASSGSLLTIDGCVFHGKMLSSFSNQIIHSSSYGILGSTSTTLVPVVNVTNCYTTGYIVGSSYGIAGPSANSIVNIKNCYASGYLDSGAHGICSSTNRAIRNCFSRDPNVNTGGQNLHFIKGEHQIFLSTREWKAVKHSYPIIEALQRKPWNKHYDNYLDLPCLY